MDKELYTIGSKLKQARIDKGLSLEQVQQKTKIHINILNAIEADKLQDFNPIYIKGFLKIYAQYLGFDPGKIIEQYQVMFRPKEEPILRKDRPKAPISISMDLLKLKIKLVFRIIVVICIVLVFIRLFSGLKSKKATSSAKKIEVAKKNATTPIKKLPLKKDVKKDATIKLAIRAKEDSWIQLSCDGKKIFEGILKKGMNESWTAKNEIRLSVGNAGGLDIEVNDKILSPLGRKGQVLKDILITNEGISTVGGLR